MTDELRYGVLIDAPARRRSSTRLPPPGRPGGLLWPRTTPVGSSNPRCDLRAGGVGRSAFGPARRSPLSPLPRLYESSTGRSGSCSPRQSSAPTPSSLGLHHRADIRDKQNGHTLMTMIQSRLDRPPSCATSTRAEFRTPLTGWNASCGRAHRAGRHWTAVSDCRCSTIVSSSSARPTPRSSPGTTEALALVFGTQQTHRVRRDATAPETWVALWNGDQAHDPQATGMLNAIVAPLAARELPVWIASSFDGDLVLVPADRLDDAVDALRHAGHQVAQ